jgi:hypothetical protein
MKKILLTVCIGGMLAFVACHREQKSTAAQIKSANAVALPGQNR